MKKIYLCFLVISSITYGQYLLNFDSFNNGNVSPQSPLIRLWPAAGVTDGQVTTAQAFSGTKSVLIRGNQTDDISMDLGNRTTGTWTIRFKLYVPAGKNAFWNIQNTNNFTSTATAQWNGQFFIGNTNSNPNAPDVGFDQDFGATVTYPTNQWFDVVKVVNMDAKTLTVHINNQPLVVDHPYSYVEGDNLIEADSLGELNFYSIDNNNEYYIDNFELVEGDALSSTAFENEALFSVYPNPATDYIQVNLNQRTNQTTFEVVDLSGRVILTTKSESINVSHFNAGVYILNVKENGQNIGSTKIIKK